MFTVNTLTLNILIMTNYNSSASGSTGMGPSTGIVGMTAHNAIHPCSCASSGNGLANFSMRLLGRVRHHGPSLRFGFGPVTISTTFMTVSTNRISVVTGRVHHGPAHRTGCCCAGRIGGCSAHGLMIGGSHGSVSGLSSLGNGGVTIAASSRFGRLMGRFGRATGPRVRIVCASGTNTRALGLITANHTSTTNRCRCIVGSTVGSHNLPLGTMNSMLTMMPACFLSGHASSVGRMGRGVSGAVGRVHTSNALGGLSRRCLNKSCAFSPARGWQVNHLNNLVLLYLRTEYCYKRMF